MGWYNIGFVLFGDFADFGCFLANFVVLRCLGAVAVFGVVPLVCLVFGLVFVDCGLWF